MDKTTQILAKQRCIPMAKLMNMSHAQQLFEALVQSNVRAINISSHIPEGTQLLNYLAKQEGIVAGAGNVQTIEQAREALDNGASFLFSPVFDTRMIELCNGKNIPIYPVTTHAEKAKQAGLTVLGCYPVEELGGFDYIEKMSREGDFSFIVAGSIAENKMDYYLSHPHVLAMTGGWMFLPQHVQQNNFKAITEALNRVCAYQKAER